MLVIDFDKYRKHLNLEDYINFVAQNEFHQFDQDIINIKFQDQIYHLSPKWSMMSDYYHNIKYLPK